MSPILLLILFSILSGLLICIVDRRWAPHLSLSASVISLLYFLFLLIDFQPAGGANHLFQANWIPGINASFSLALDAQNVLLLLLSFLVLPVGILASWNDSVQRNKEYYALMSFGSAALTGFFAAQNPFTFYLFFELALIPFYLIVLLYGGEYRRQAVFKFFLYTVFGSFLMLAAIIYLYSIVPGTDINWTTAVAEQLGPQNQMWIFGALFIAFAIKSPLFPFHTWQADLYSEGDRPAVMIIAGVLSKMGVFGFIRFYEFVPSALESLRYLIIPLCIVGIIYGALVAWRQTVMTRILAYSSLSHMGMIAAALFSGTLVGMQGSLFQMFTHGILAASLFFVVDAVIRRTGDTSVYGSAGLAQANPRLSVYFFIIVLASVGLPLTSGFIGEFYMLWGLTQSNIWYGALAGISIILGAIYMLRFYQKSVFGEMQSDKVRNFGNLHLAEDYVLVVVVILVLSFGFFPGTWMDLTQQAFAQLIQK